jgi:two-component system phosphate regulon sensor histidine kinase PhoR
MLFPLRFNNRPVKLLLVFTFALTVAWVIDPALAGSTWVARSLLVGGCLTVATLLFQMEVRRQTISERLALRHIESLCAVDHHDQSANKQHLPTIHPINPWSKICIRIRDCMAEHRRRADEAEHAWTGAEFRVRRVSRELAQLTSVLDGLMHPTIATNQFDEVTFANQRARTLFDFSLDEESPQPLVNLVPAATLVDLMHETRKRKSPAPRHCELEWTDANGSTSWFRVQCRVMEDLGGSDEDEQGAVAVLTDISDQRDIRRRHAEFVSAASHEMKTPLAGIRAYAELLLDGEAEDEETRDEFLSVIDTQADRLQRLIDNLLNIARIEAGVVKVDKQQQSLNELLDHAFQVVQPSAEQKQIQLVSDLSPMFLGVLADRDMLMQCAINLLSNAVKYTAPGGRVTLRSRMEDDSALFEVEDTGVGLSEEDCQRVFEKFYRVKKDQQMAPGTGLGLPLAKHIAEDVHSGSLSATSQLGQGSVFRVSLPKHR